MEPFRYSFETDEQYQARVEQYQAQQQVPAPQQQQPTPHRLTILGLPWWLFAIFVVVILVAIWRSSQQKLRRKLNEHATSSRPHWPDAVL